LDIHPASIKTFREEPSAALLTFQLAVYFGCENLLLKEDALLVILAINNISSYVLSS